eukprot:scaffold10552_cov276-Chaetoceros_neogracile.AAC.40
MILPAKCFLKSSILITAIFALSATSIIAKKSSAPSPYKELANYLSKSITDHPISSIQSTLSVLAKSQSTLKSIDGASHEFYQRSHNNSVKGSSGRIERSAGRMGCCADSLLACELLDWLNLYKQKELELEFIQKDTSKGKVFKETEDDDDDSNDDDDSTLDLNERKVVLDTRIEDPIPMRVVVLLESNYRGDAGMNHGGIDGLTMAPDATPRRRYLVIIKDDHENDLERTLEILDSNPEFLDLDVGLVSGEVASVNKVLRLAAQKVLEACADCWDVDLSTDEVESDDQDQNKSEHNGVNDVQRDNEKDKDSFAITKTRSNPGSLPVFHFVGRSLAGGVASLAAAMVDGSIPMPRQKRKRKRSAPKGKSNHLSHKRGRGIISNEGKGSNGAKALDDTIANERKKLVGFGPGRASAVAIGAPPSISANIKATFITSVICGDDLVSRSSKASLDRLRKRAKKRLEGGLLTKQVGWMTDTLSLTMSSLQSHAHGSEGEEARLSIPGKVYLVRPRRMSGGVSSMHEIGRGRDALRATVLWQLNDVLLSRSLWKHHSLDSYTTSLDKVQLRTIDDEYHEEEVFNESEEYGKMYS